MTDSKNPRKSLFDRRASTKQGRLGLTAAKAALRVAELLNLAKNASGLTSKQIANELEVTEGRVSQVLNGDGNLHIASIARYLAVCGYELRLIAQPVQPDRPPLDRGRGRRSRRSSGAVAWDVVEQLYMTHDSVRTELAAFRRPAGPKPILLGEPRVIGEVTFVGGERLAFNPAKGATGQWLKEVRSADRIEEETQAPVKR